VILLKKFHKKISRLTVMLLPIN